VQPYDAGGAFKAAAPIGRGRRLRFFGPDPANLRLDRIGAGEAVLVAAEETSADADIGHAAEIAAGLVFEGEGVVTGGDWVD